MGIPGVSFVDNFKRKMKWNVPQDELRFYDTKLASNVLNAFQALALDEMRYSFQPALWEKPASLTTVCEYLMIFLDLLTVSRILSKCGSQGYIPMLAAAKTSKSCRI
jgi:hypothetical protein